MPQWAGEYKPLTSQNQLLNFVLFSVDPESTSGIMATTPAARVRLEASPGQRSTDFDFQICDIDANFHSSVTTDGLEEVIVTREQASRSHLLVQLLKGGGCSLPVTKQAFRQWLDFTGESERALHELCDVVEVRIQGLSAYLSCPRTSQPVKTL